MPFFGVPIRNGLPIGLGSVAGFGVQQFDPSQLFEGGTVAGAWYDPSDLSTMFDTSTGTTPVAMPGQGAAVPVGLMLDKSQGLVLGSELVTNGTFASGTGWTLTNGASISGGQAVIATTSSFPSLQQSIVVSANKLFQVTVDVISISGTLQFIFWDGASSNASNIYSTTTTGTKTFYFLTTATTASLVIGRGLATTSGGTIDNISVRELPGSHAISFNNTTARPELRARVNLLTYSEEFDNGAWTSAGGPAVTRTPNTEIAPDGTLTADTIAYASGVNFPVCGINVSPNLSNSATYIYSLRVKDIDSRYVYLSVRGNSTNVYVAVEFDLNTNTVNRTFQQGTDWTYVASSGVVVATTNGFKVISFNFTTGTSTAPIAFFGASNNTNTFNSGGYSDAFAASKSFYAWGADLRPANIGANVPAYQRIADANTYDTSGFPLYLRFDGADDGMSMSLAVSTLNLSAFAGVRETGNSINNNRYFFIGDATGSVNNLSGFINGQTAANSTIGYRWPENEPVVTVLGTQTSAVISYQRTSTTLQTARLNGIAATSNTNLTTTFTSAIGRIGCTVSSSVNAVFFPGNIYSLIIAGSAVSAGNISATEQWVAGRTGIQI